MSDFLRLKQICLLASDLKPAALDIGEVMGLDICYRDPHVGAYGLENVLYPVDSILLEVVAPTREDTAVGRYLERLKRPDVKEGWRVGATTPNLSVSASRMRLRGPKCTSCNCILLIAAARSSISIAPRIATAFTVLTLWRAPTGRNLFVRTQRWR